MGQDTTAPAIAELVDAFLALAREVHPAADIRVTSNQVQVYVEERLLATVWPLAMHVTVTFPGGQVKGEVAKSLDSSRMLMLRPQKGLNEDFVRNLLVAAG